MAKDKDYSQLAMPICLIVLSDTETLTSPPHMLLVWALVLK